MLLVRARTAPAPRRSGSGPNGGAGWQNGGVSIGEELLEERRRRRRAGDPRFTEVDREHARRLTTGDLVGEFKAALDAASPAAGSPLYFPDAGGPHATGVAYLSGSLEPGVYVDISGTIEQKTEAILCHASQLGETGEWFREVLSERAEQAGRAAGVPYAEAFRRIRFGS